MIQILDENNFFYTIHKPAGFSVHNETPSVLEFIQKLGKSDHFVNRLDLETSGLMIIAKDPKYHAPLSESLHRGTKTYRALLRGEIKDSTIDSSPLIWDRPLTDKSEGRKNPQGTAKDRVPCRTEVRIKRKNKYLSEVFAEIKTGRQHQIRKHAALAGHPIVGDKRYNDPKYNEKIFKMFSSQRLFLHAEKLEFHFQNQLYNYISTDFSLDHFF